VRRRIILLGRYPLFGYIIQIALLQILRRSLHGIDLGTVPLGLTFVAAVALTVMAVIAMDRVRATSLVVDQLYKGVFA
jgi:hypothetical protein